MRSIAKEIHEPETFVRAELNRLAEKGIIAINKSKKPHRLFSNKKKTKPVSVYRGVVL